VKVVRDFPESLQDHRVFELAEIGTSSSEERYRTGDRLTAGHRLRTPDCSGFVGTLDRLTGRAAAVNMHKGQRYVVDHRRPAPRRQAPPRLKPSGVVRLLFKGRCFPTR
jgi:hypothetical protein